MNTSGNVIAPAARLAIEDLLSEFSSRVDGDKADTVHELFVESGRIETPLFVLASRDEIHQRFTARARDTTRKTRHYWSNPRFSGDERQITVVTNVMTVINVAGAQTVITGGTSTDVVVPHAEGWAFQSRRLEVIFEGTLGAREPHP